MGNLKRGISRRSMVAGSLGTLFAGAAVALPVSTSGQMYPGTSTSGTDISGQTAVGSEALLRDALQVFEARAVMYTFEERTWQVSLADLGMAIDYGAMIRMAMEHGRDGSLIDRYTALIIKPTDRDIPLRLKRDGTVLRALLEGIGRDLALAPRDARLDLQDGKVAVVDHIVGREPDVERAIADTNREITVGEPITIELMTLPVEPQLKAADLEGAREEALKLFSAPISFTHVGFSYPADVATLTAALTIGEDNTASLDMDAMKVHLDAIAAAVYIPPQNVKLGWDSGLYVVEGDVDGVAVDQQALVEAVQKLTLSSNRTAMLPVKPVQALARADNMDDLRIEGHIAYGSSSFAGSSAARAENVVVSARNISYKLVAPGEIFSFNDLLGPITLENGYVEGKIIEGDFAATDIGGGVCQVSTTVFRAAANAGFQFTEWNPHTWRLDFYEEDGSPPGYDGAIYQSEDYELDLAFQNPLDSWLLLMTVIDAGTVHAHLYGRSNGWTVKLGLPRISEPKPNLETVERVNPNLLPSDRILVQQAQAGVTVAIRRTVIAADGAIVSDGDFVSDYQSVPEAWEIGPS